MRACRLREGADGRGGEVHSLDLRAAALGKHLRAVEQRLGYLILRVACEL